MTQLIPQQTEDADTLNEYRERQFQYYQGKIGHLIAEFHDLDEKTTNKAKELAEVLHAADQEKIYEVDGYKSMYQWVHARWPSVSRSRLSQLITFGEMVAEVKVFTNSQIGKHFELENERQARALSQVPSEKREEVFTQAVAASDGGVPSAALIAETHDRISTLDTEPGPKQSKEPKPAPAPTSGDRKKSFGYIDLPSVDTSTSDRKIYLTFVRPAFTSNSGTQVKEMRAQGLSLPFRILEEQGWTPPRHKFEADDDQPEQELQGSFLEGRDFSHLDAPTPVDLFFQEYPQ